MRKGITSTILFNLPDEISVSDLADARITVRQRDENRINRPLDTLTVNTRENSLQMLLTQEEALRLTDECPAEIQLKVKLIGGTVLATPIYRTSVRSILNEEVI